MSVEREVIYRLRVIADEGNPRALGSVGSGYETLFKQLESRENAIRKLMEERSQREKTIVEASVSARIAAERKATEAAAREARASVDIQKREAERASQMREREIAQRQAKEREYSSWWSKEVAAREKEAERARKVEAAGIKQLEREHISSLGKIKMGQGQLVEGIYGTAEGVGRLARGFALMGFVADENLQDLIQKLAVVQGTFDLVLGGVKAYHSLTKAVEGYKAAVQAAAVAEAAAGAIRARGAAAGAGSSLLANAGSLAGGSGIVRGAGFLAAAAKPVAVILAAAGAAKNVQEIASGTAGAPGTFSGGFGRAIFGAEMWAQKTFGAQNNVYGDAYRSNQKTEALVNRRTAEEAMREQKIARLGLANDYQDSSRSLKYGDLDMRLSFQSSAADRVALTQRYQQDASKDVFMSRSAMNATGVNSDERESAQKRYISDMENLIALEEKLAQEQQAAATFKIDAAKQSLDYTRQELDLVNQRQKSATDSLQSAKVRFGDMAPEEQVRLIGIKKKADLDPNSLTREERQTLRGIGLENESMRADLGSMNAADKAGYNEIFGDAERATAKRNEKLQQEINVELQDQSDIVVKLEADAAAIAKNAAAKLQPMLDELKEEIGKQIAEQFRKASVDLAKNGPANRAAEGRAAQK